MHALHEHPHTYMYLENNKPIYLTIIYYVIFYIPMAFSNCSRDFPCTIVQVLDEFCRI
jgi:hypothetical protein